MIAMSYKDVLIAVLLICTIILVVYLITILKRLGPIISNLERITEKAETITDEALSSLDELKIISKATGESVEQLSASLGNVSKLLNGRKNTVKAAATVTNAAAGLINLFRK